MELIKEITDSDLTKENVKAPPKYRLRRAARGVIFNKNKVAIMYASKIGYHKLPGGGIDDGEKKLHAFKREIKEETGCNVKNVKELGIVIEYRNSQKLLQVSYSYIAKLKGEAGEPSLTKKEERQGFKLKWVSIDEAIKLVSRKSEHTGIGFMQKRDTSILKAAKKQVSSKSI